MVTCRRTDTEIFQPLPQRFYRRSAVAIAPDLLGRVLVHRSAAGLYAGVIVETEAYDEADPASHSYSGMTARNQAMFGPAGVAYVYRSYGVHWCFNVVAGAPGRGAAVMIRALEPIAGIELMRQRRGCGDSARELRDLCRGPGRLCAALGIDAQHYGLHLDRAPLWVANPTGRFRRPIPRQTPRIGISRAQDIPWRFCVRDCVHVSGPTRLR